MRLTDAIVNDNGYSPIFTESKAVDDILTLDSIKVRNLVNSIVSDMGIPNSSTISLLTNKLKVSDKTKIEVSNLTKSLIDALSNVTNSSETYKLSEKYFSDIRSLVSEDVSSAISDSIDAVSEASRSLSDNSTSDSLDDLAASVNDSISDSSQIEVEDSESSSTDSVYIDNTESEESVPDTDKPLTSEASEEEVSDSEGVETTEVEKEDSDSNPSITSDPEETFGSDSEDPLEKLHESIEEFDYFLSRSKSNAKDAWESMIRDVKSGNTPDEIVSNIYSPMTSVISGIVSEIIEAPLVNIARSDTFKSLANPSLFVNEFASQVSAEIVKSFKDVSEVFTKAPVEALDRVVHTFKDSMTTSVKYGIQDLRDKLLDKTSNITNFTNNYAQSKEDSILRLFGFKKSHKIEMETDWKGKLNYGRSGGVRSDRLYDSYDIQITEPTVKNSDPVKRSNFKVNKDNLYMVNDEFWDVEIKPHMHNSVPNSAPPDLNDIFNCKEGRLPILSYSLEAGGLSASSFEIYPGVMFSVPLNYSRPSTFSCTLVNLVKMNSDGSQIACIDEFRDRYVEWVVGENIEHEFGTLPACLDYHYCAYEITVTKYSSQWVKLRRWELLGIPHISISEQGQSSSSQEIQSLSFAIVGGNSSNYSM